MNNPPHRATLYACAIIVLMAWACLPIRLSAASTIRIATWNLNNLHDTPGQALRSRAPSRSKRDYAVLRRYAKQIDADIYALQEVNGPKAARRVFPTAHYQLFFSGRHGVDQESKRRSDRIYTAFAVKKGRFDQVVKKDYRALSVMHAGRPTRWGVELVITRGTTKMHLLNVHLKSRCFTDSLRRARDQHCATLSRQVSPLEEWIDARARQGVAFAVLGDFNRALDVHGPRDHLWRAIDDSEPTGLRLFRYPFQRASNCWRHTANYHENPIDFIVVDGRTQSWVIPKTAKQWDYSPNDCDPKRGLPSDHCPLSLDLALPR